MESTCHWCHVMEKESFEDEEIASILNGHYVSIKVDREERPDVDHLYMTVCQAMTGQGGWPLTIIMTPEQKPFFAGTYFPKDEKVGRIGLKTLLSKVARLWREERTRATETGERVIEAVRQYLNPVEEGDWSEEVFDHAFEQFASQFDDIYGGFGDAPKFPRPHDLLFLLRYWRMTGEEEALHMVTHTLDCMRRGGIFDQLGYGFARYSVDREWLVPHFEKMLYDNALLAIAYLEVYQATQEEKYAQVAREIFHYVLRDMTSPDGGFYSAEDADSEGEEGKFYIWTPAEIADILGEPEAALFCACFGMTEEGNFEQGTTVLNQIGFQLERVAQEQGISPDALQEKLNQLREKLFTAREKRVHPHKDDKILLSWNGLMIAALARGARVLDEMMYAEAAGQAVNLIQDRLMREDGRLLARYRDGEAAHLGYLDDYAFLAWGLMELYEATFEGRYLEQALTLTRQMISLFEDPDEGGFYFYGKDAEKLLVRPKEIYDGAIPSGNSVATYNLLRLAQLTMDEELSRVAERQMKAFAKSVASSPISHSFFLVALQFAHGPKKEIVISGYPNEGATKKMIRIVQRAYLPEAVIALSPRGEAAATMKFMTPTSLEKPADEHGPLVFICENFACQRPIADVEELKERLTANRPA